MTILDAITELVAGNHLRRPAWPQGAYMDSPEQRPGPSAWMFHDSMGGAVHFMDVPTYAEDSQADDWEVLP